MRRLHPHDLRAGAAFGDELLKVKREPGRDGLPRGQSPVVAQRTASGGRRAYPACGGRSFPRTGTCRLLGNLLPHALDSARAWRPVDERLERATHRDPDGAAVNASAIIPGCVSVVIPALDEAVSLACLIEALRREPELKEIIVVDGGSIDGTAAVAARLGARVVTSERGRGQQLRTGGALATGDYLLFLHADTTFPRRGLAAFAALLDRDPRVPGGNFRVVFDGDTRFARGLTVFYAWIRRFALYYGDSGIFVRRAVYSELGGFRPMALTEDYDFVRRLERAGPTCRVEHPTLVTSSRKFAGRRPVAIVWGWALIHFLYWAGVSPARLSRIYYRASRSGRGTSMSRQS